MVDTLVSGQAREALYQPTGPAAIVTSIVREVLYRPAAPSSSIGSLVRETMYQQGAGTTSMSSVAREALYQPPAPATYIDAVMREVLYAPPFPIYIGGIVRETLYVPPPAATLISSFIRETLYTSNQPLPPPPALNPKPNAVDVFPGTNTKVNVAGISVEVAPANVVGGVIMNPWAAADQGLNTPAPLYVDPVGTPRGSGFANGSTFTILPGVTWKVFPGQISPTKVNSDNTAHKFSAIFWQVAKK